MGWAPWPNDHVQVSTTANPYLAPWYAAAADFNGDGLADLALERWDFTTTTTEIQVLSSLRQASAQPMGHLDRARSLFFAAERAEGPLTATDLNSDGVPDLLTLSTNPATDGLRHHAGIPYQPDRFGLPVDPGPNTPNTVAVAADFTDDERKDLAVIRTHFWGPTQEEGVADLVRNTVDSWEALRWVPALDPVPCPPRSTCRRCARS